MSSYTEGQVHQLANALEGEGFTPDDVTKLGQNKGLGDIRGVLRGTHEIKPIEYIIDCNADPFIPVGWEVEEHQKRGLFKWDPAQIRLYLSPPLHDHDDHVCIKGYELREKLKGESVLNANVLDYLLQNQHLIPEGWKRRNAFCVFFWGTVYCRPVGGRRDEILPCVRGLTWEDNGVWGCDYLWLNFYWYNNHPAACIS